MGLPLEHKYGLEKLFYDYGQNISSMNCISIDKRNGASYNQHAGYNVSPYISTAYGRLCFIFISGVDLVLSAHEHAYERMWPLYNRTVRVFHLYYCSVT